MYNLNHIQFWWYIILGLCIPKLNLKSTPYPTPHTLHPAVFGPRAGWITWSTTRQKNNSESQYIVILRSRYTRISAENFCQVCEPLIPTPFVAWTNPLFAWTKQSPLTPLISSPWNSLCLSLSLPIPLPLALAPFPSSSPSSSPSPSPSPSQSLSLSHSHSLPIPLRQIAGEISRQVCRTC